MSFILPGPNAVSYVRTVGLRERPKPGCRLSRHPVNGVEQAKWAVLFAGRPAIDYLEYLVEFLVFLLQIR